MADYLEGHPLHHVANVIDGEHSLEAHYDAEMGRDHHAQALSMRARQLGAEHLDAIERSDVLPLSGVGPELVHEARRAINHGYSVIVSVHGEPKGLAIAYRSDGTFLVVDDGGGKRWEPGAFLMREGDGDDAVPAELSIVVAKLSAPKPKEPAKTKEPTKEPA